MSQLYFFGREKFAKGQIDWSVGSYRAALMLDTYAYRDADEFLDDISAYIAARSEVVSGRTTDGGYCSANDIIFLNAISSGPVGKLVVFKDTGDDATSPVLAYYDDVAGLPTTLNGGRYDVLVDQSFGGLWRI